MDATTTSAMHVIKKEDKQSILHAFLSQDLEARRAAPASLSDGSNSLLLVARSPESPVARAVAALADEFAGLGITISAVFAQSAPNAALRQGGGKCTDANNSRVLTDARLLDAHETLLLGGTTAWVGDCMRRDPATNDAYERYASNCTFTNASAHSAFEQLWKTARPISSTWLTASGHDEKSVIAEDDMIASSSLPPVESEAWRAPATRH